MESVTVESRHREEEPVGGMINLLMPTYLWLNGMMSDGARHVVRLHQNVEGGGAGVGAPGIGA